MITINYTRQNTGAYAGLRSVQFVLDENLGLDGMLHELTQFLRAMGYPIDSDETLLVVSEWDTEFLQKNYYASQDDIQQADPVCRRQAEIEKVMQDLVDEAKAEAREIQE